MNTQEAEMFRALTALKAQGQEIMEVSDKQMHMLLSAYITTIMEPIIHDYTEEETEVCLSTVLEFFYAGLDENNGILKEPK